MSADCVAAVFHKHVAPEARHELCGILLKNVHAHGNDRAWHAAGFREGQGFNGLQASRRDFSETYRVAAYNVRDNVRAACRRNVENLNVYSVVHAARGNHLKLCRAFKYVPENRREYRRCREFACRDNAPGIVAYCIENY